MPCSLWGRGWIDTKITKKQERKQKRRHLSVSPLVDKLDCPNQFTTLKKNIVSVLFRYHFFFKLSINKNSLTTFIVKRKTWQWTFSFFEIIQFFFFLPISQFYLSFFSHLTAFLLMSSVFWQIGHLQPQVAFHPRLMTARHKSMSSHKSSEYMKPNIFCILYISCKWICKAIN